MRREEKRRREFRNWEVTINEVEDDSVGWFFYRFDSIFYDPSPEICAFASSGPKYSLIIFLFQLRMGMSFFFVFFSFQKNV